MAQESKFHPAVEMFKTEYENGEMNRREFMARATTLGVTAAGAYGLIGAVQPAYARPYKEWRNITNADGSESSEGSKDL